MSIKVEVVEGEPALTDFLLLHDRIVESAGAWWPTMVPMFLPALLNEGPFAEDRRSKAFWALEGGQPVATVQAMVDERYVRHWGEQLGHLLHFEALPDARAAARAVMDEACGWLREQGMDAARCGFGGGEMPFVLDVYDALPPMLVHQNPPYYHAFLKDAGFETEKGWVDYKVEVTPDLLRRWQSALDSALRAGFDIVPLSKVAEDQRVRQFTDTFNRSFANHWGFSPWTEAELELLVGTMGPLGMLDCSVLAYRDEQPVGFLWVVPELSMMAATAPGRELRPDERLNFLGIGVLDEARGRGVNLAMAGFAYLELASRGATHVSYTLVVDDNWPSRRTAEKLGAAVCANYVVYRRNFRRA